jgi:hypothetical protein
MCSRAGGRWDESFPGTPSYREVTPAQPVVINLDQALARDNPSLRTTNPLRVSAGGLRLTGYCAGQLHAWVRLTTGTWMGECTFTVHSAATTGQHSSCGTGCPPVPSPRNGTDRG